MRIVTLTDPGIVVKGLLNATASLPAADDQGHGGIVIDTVTGDVTVTDLVITLADIQLGAFEVKVFSVSYKTDANNEHRF